MSSKAARREQFEGVFQRIRDELVDSCKGEGLPTEALEWYRSVWMSCCVARSLFVHNI